MIGTDHFRATSSHHKNLSLTRDRFQILRARVGHRDGGVRRLKHEGHRLTHQDAAAHHDGTLAGGINPLITKHHHHACRRAASWTLFTLQQAPKIQGVQSISIFIWIDFSQERGLI